MEGQADESWVGGTAETILTKQGNQAIKLTASNGAEASAIKALSTDLGGYDQSSGYIDQWVYVEDRSALDSDKAVTITFDSTLSSTFYKEVPRNQLNDGWNLLHIQKSSFNFTGAPSWKQILGVKNTIKAASGPTANVVFDDLRLMSNRRITGLKTYDALNRMISETDALGQTARFVYDAAGNQTNRIDSKDNTTTISFDALNRETTTTDPMGISTVNGYDVVGQRTSIKIDGKNTTFTYDLLGRETTVTDPMGNSTHSYYDAVGNKIMEIDPSGYDTSFTHDANSRMIAERDGEGAITGYEYDEEGNQTTIIPPAPAEITIQVFDALDRLANKTEGTATVYHYYDAGSQETTTVLEDGGTIVNTYNKLGQILSSADSSGVATSATYDITGNKLSDSGDGITTYYRYDESGRINKTVDSEGQISTTAYDENGNRINSSDANGVVVSTYDHNNRLVVMAPEDDATATTFDYNGRGMRTEMVQANLTKTAYDYDDAGHLTSLDTSANGESLLNEAYSYNAAGSIATETVTAQGTTTYKYDRVGRLTSWKNYAGVETTYAYDRNGNLKSISSPTGETTFVVNSKNNLIRSHNAAGTTTYTVSVGFRMKKVGPSGAQWTYSWDKVKGRLMSVDGPSFQTSYAYGAYGKRQYKIVDGVKTKFVYDGIKLIATKDAANNITARYYYDNNNRLVSMKKYGQNSGNYYFHLNARGDVKKITNSIGTTVATYSYDPWGNILSQSGSFAGQQPFRYAGYYWDSEIGMYYVMARYYDPVTGRFISKDPITKSNAAAYGYADNDPVNRTDPTGLTSEPIEFFHQRNSSDYLLKVLRVNAGAARLILTLYNWSVLEAGHKKDFFVEMVRGKGPWDLKQGAGSLQEVNFLEFKYYTPFLISPDIFGNIHYGYVGRAYGYPLWLLKLGSWWANRDNGGKSPEDEGWDQEYIKDGFGLYDTHGTQKNWSRWQTTMYVNPYAQGFGY